MLGKNWGAVTLRGREDLFEGPTDSVCYSQRPERPRVGHALRSAWARWPEFHPSGLSAATSSILGAGGAGHRRASSPGNNVQPRKQLDSSLVLIYTDKKKAGNL